MKLRGYRWGGADDPAVVTLVLELASRDEVNKMRRFIDWLEREKDGIPVDDQQERAEEYEKNKPDLCPHGMNLVSCPDVECMREMRRRAQMRVMDKRAQRVLSREEELQGVLKRQRGW